MRRLALIGLILALTSCTWFRDPPPERRITPGSQIIYDSGMGDTVFTTCYKGNLVFMTTKSSQLVVLQGGCPSGNP